MNEHLNREAWLSKLIEAWRPEFASRGHKLPDNIRVTFGWTTCRNAVGQCFPSNATRDDHFEIFISPKHPDCEPHTLAETLVHELIHTLPGCNNHGKKFKKVSTIMGLEGPAVANHGGPELWKWIDTHLEALGPFLGTEVKRALTIKKQTTRMLKCECPACGFIFRASQTAIDAVKGDTDEMRCPGKDCSGSIQIAA